MISKSLKLLFVIFVLKLPSLVDSRWTKANQNAAQRQTELEVCADRLGSFAAAASQLGPWLREKELMMSVLGPLSIDPNMLNTQKQQVQVNRFLMIFFLFCLPNYLPGQQIYDHHRIGVFTQYLLNTGC